MKKIALIGSTRFKSVFEEVSLEETLKGNVVFSLGAFITEDDLKKRGITFEDVEQILYDTCEEKMELADEVYVIDVDGYIGFHTNIDITNAKALGKPIRYYSEGFK